MSTDEVAQDVSQVTDFHFHACRKFRLFSQKVESSSNDIIVRNRLATSSHLGVSFALIGTNQLACFPTKSLLGFKVTRENMNVEVTDLSVKSVRLFGVESINDMGVNSDGKLLAILHTRNSDVSVDVFDIETVCSSSSSGAMKPICTTRVGTEQINQGSCLEWNPAFPDTFAAASTDRSIMVAKINPQNPSSQKLIGIGKLGAITTAISWSPKGKQLTIGDSLGKIVQLKPELDVVRSQFGPEHTPPYGKVTGLCWLATTEWLVSFELGSDHDTFLMRCKKDKATEWVQYHDLSYSSSKWSFTPQLFPTAQLLVDWNVVITGNSKTSEIVTVGKRDDWKTWVLMEGDGIYLPTTSNGEDSVPIGVAVDRSMTEVVSLKADGSRNHPPSPLVLCLTNDGVLTAHHVISTFAAHKSCQLASQCISITGMKKLQMEMQNAVVATTATSTSTSPHIPKSSTIFDQKPKTASVTNVPESNLFGLPTVSPKLESSLDPAPSSLFGEKKPSTPDPASTALTTSSKSNHVSLSPPTTAASSNPEDIGTPEEKKTEALAASKKHLIERVMKINNAMTLTKDSIMKATFAVGKVKNTVLECAEVVQGSLGDSKEVIDELKSLIFSIERMSDRTQHSVKEMDFEIDEKMELVAGVEDGERILEKLRNMSETEKLMRFNKLETTADLLNGKFEECCDKIKKLRINLTEKESFRKQAVLSPLRHNSNLNQLRSGAETEVALKVMRNVSKIIIDTRDRIQRTELEFVRFKRKMKSEPNQKATRNASTVQPAKISIMNGDIPQRGELSDAEVIKARQLLASRIQKRGPIKTKDITIESYKKSTEPRPKINEEIDTSNLSNAILKLSMTPRRVMPTPSLFSTSSATPSTRSDAATQADEPAVVKTVVVTVESPAKTITAIPVVATPVLKPTTTISTASISTAKPIIPKEEVEEQTQQKIGQKPPAPITTPSSIFSGSLFGSKTPQTPVTDATPSTLSTGNYSIFGSSLNISPQEQENVATKTDIKTEKSEIPVVEEVKEKEQSKDAKTFVNEKETPAATSEERKFEPEVKAEPNVTVTTESQGPSPVLTKEASTPKTPSFSFNSTTTPKSTTSTSSIFGGGLKSQTPSSTAASSIFGGTSQTTPIAAANSSSIFGGGAKSTTSPFGNFGQAAAQTSQAENPAPAPASSISFSFNSGTSAVPAKPAGFGAFGGSVAAKPSSVFGASITAPTIPNVDDGMEDDSMVNGGGPGGFLSGLGSTGTPNTSTSVNNPFAPKLPTASESTSSWLFGGGAAQQQSQQQQQKPSFSFNNSGTSQQPAGALSSSTTSAFGGAPKFGSQPVFGAKPFGGGSTTAASGLSKNSSIFGGAVPSAPTTGGFAQFATGQKASSLFGGGAAAASQPNTSIFGGGANTTAAASQPNTSIFGGGANTTAAPTSSIFGGGASTNANKASFTSWR